MDTALFKHCNANHKRLEQGLGTLSSNRSFHSKAFLSALPSLKTGQGIVPGVTGLRQTIIQIVQLTDVFRVEHLFGLQLEMIRDTGKIIVESNG